MGSATAQEFREAVRACFLPLEKRYGFRVVDVGRPDAMHVQYRSSATRVDFGWHKGGLEVALGPASSGRSYQLHSILQVLCPEKSFSYPEPKAWSEPGVRTELTRLCEILGTYCSATLEGDFERVKSADDQDSKREFDAWFRRASQSKRESES